MFYPKHLIHIKVSISNTSIKDDLEGANSGAPVLSLQALHTSQWYYMRRPSAGHSVHTF